MLSYLDSIANEQLVTDELDDVINEPWRTEMPLSPTREADNGGGPYRSGHGNDPTPSEGEVTCSGDLIRDLSDAIEHDMTFTEPRYYNNRQKSTWSHRGHVVKDAVLLKHNRFKLGRWFNGLFGDGNQRKIDTRKDDCYNLLVQEILNFEPAPNEHNVVGKSCYNLSLQERIKGGNRKLPRYLKHLLDLVHTKWPLLKKSGANDKMLHKFLSDHMEDHNVRIRDRSEILPLAIMLSYVPTESMLVSQEIEASLYIQDSKQKYKNGVTSLAGHRVRPNEEE